MDYELSGELEEKIEFGEMDNRFFLIGLLNRFINRFQAVGDRFFSEISWKQCFTMICLQYFKEPPTLQELSLMMGSSHQNVKQMLLKLEKNGFVAFVADETDKRKQRIVLTDKARKFCEHYDLPSENYVGQLFEVVGQEDLETTVKTLMLLDERLQLMQKQDSNKNKPIAKRREKR